MKYLFQFSLLFTVLVFHSVFAQEFDNKDGVTFTEEERQKYIGEYIVTIDNEKKSRHIIIKNDTFYYVVNNEMQIPLKPKSKTKFNLYPSATYLYFKFDKNGNVVKLEIKKGSGGTLRGKKIK